MTSTNKKSLHRLHQKANPCTVACFLSLFTAHQTTSFPNSQQEELARHQINKHIHVILHAHQTNLLISSPLQLPFNPLPHQRLLVDFRLLLFTFDLCSPNIHPQFSNTTPHRSKCPLKRIPLFQFSTLFPKPHLHKQNTPTHHSRMPPSMSSSSCSRIVSSPNSAPPPLNGCLARASCLLS